MNKFRLYDQKTGRLVYMLMVNENETQQYEEDKKHENQNKMSLKYSIPYERMYWEELK